MRVMSSSKEVVCVMLLSSRAPDEAGQACVHLHAIHLLAGAYHHIIYNTHEVAKTGNGAAKLAADMIDSDSFLRFAVLKTAVVTARTKTCMLTGGQCLASPASDSRATAPIG